MRLEVRKLRQAPELQPPEILYDSGYLLEREKLPILYTGLAASGAHAWITLLDILDFYKYITSITIPKTNTYIVDFR